MHLRITRPVVSALSMALLVLAVAEAGLRLVKRADPVPASYEVPRNPRFRRDWVRYTQPRPRPQGTRLVIVIANSQGFLREERDGALAWPSRLESRLGRQGIGAIVANWSIPAANAAEMILLAARAASHRPDLVVVSAGAATFLSRDNSRRPLTFWLSDATDLAYVPSVRRILPQGFLRRTHAYDPVAAWQAWSAIAWVRSRHFTAATEAWEWRVAKGRRSIERFPIPGKSSHAVTTQLRELAEPLLGASPNTRLLIAQMPLARSALDDDDHRRAGVTARFAARIFADQPCVEVVDALDVIPDERFSSATHMDSQGHDQYARWLEPRVLELLGRDPD